MRLIDADEFIKKFSYAKANTEEENIMCATVRRMVKEQPTAFDAKRLWSNWKNQEDTLQHRSIVMVCAVILRAMEEIAFNAVWII